MTEGTTKIKASVAFLGLGTMGRGMAANLMKAGLPLTVWNRNRAKAEPLARMGATVAASPAEAAKDAGVVVAMLADDAASRAAWLENMALWQRCLPEALSSSAVRSVPTGLESCMMQRLIAICAWQRLR